LQLNIREFVREAPVFYALAIAIGLSKGGDIVSKSEIRRNFTLFADDNDPDGGISLLASEPLWDLAVEWLTERGMVQVKRLAFGPAMYSRGGKFSERWHDLTSVNDGSVFGTYGTIRDGNSWLHEALNEVMSEGEKLKPTARDFARFDLPEHAAVSDPPELTENMDAVQKTDAIMNWFDENFEDPAESTPYDSREGGYLYINGGP
jgi:hypothetical protein